MGTARRVTPSIGSAMTCRELGGWCHRPLSTSAPLEGSGSLRPVRTAYFFFVLDFLAVVVVVDLWCDVFEVV